MRVLGYAGFALSRNLQTSFLTRRGQRRPLIQLSNITHSHLCGEDAPLSELYLQFSQLWHQAFILVSAASIGAASIGDIRRLYATTDFLMSARTYFLRQ
jgi:hypothetical protein